MLNSTNGTLSTANLTYAQKEKYASLLKIYNDKTLDCVTTLSSRGENSFTSLHSKLQRIEGANYEEQEYHDSVYSAFELGKTYSDAEIIGLVSEVRRDLGLLPYDKRIGQQCIRDFKQLFLYTEVFETFEIDGVEKRISKGYRPLFKIKPE